MIWVFEAIYKIPLSQIFNNRHYSLKSQHKVPKAFT